MAQLPEVDEENIRPEEPFRGIREVQYAFPESREVVVDDLDPGFSVEDNGKGGGLRILGRRSEDEETDQGIPVFAFQGRNSRWERYTHQNAYGKYRHTMALIRGGDGDRVQGGYR